MTIAGALSGLPADIAVAIEREMAEILSRFSRRDWGPAELNGGRLAEAVLRYIEWKNTGAYTPFGTQIDRLRVCREAQQNTALDDSVRFHLPGGAQLIMDIRNKRDVAHLSAVVDVNEMDSQLVVRAGSWIVAEIVRLESGLPPAQIQSLVDSLTVKHIPLVEVFDGDVVVVAPRLAASERALVRLYHDHPVPIAVAELRTSVKYANATRFREIIQDFDRRGLVHAKDGIVYLTQLGVSEAEKLLS